MALIRCPWCELTVDDSNLRCPSCRNPLGKAHPVDVAQYRRLQRSLQREESESRSAERTCRKCGRRLPAGSDHCPFCEDSPEWEEDESSWSGPDSPGEGKYYDDFGKSKVVALLLCLFFGVLGVHRFYVGKILTGLIWLITLGFLGIGVLIDLLIIATGNFTDVNGNYLE